MAKPVGPQLGWTFFCVQVVASVLLPALHAYRKTEGVRSRGCVAELEHGEADVLMHDLQHVPQWLARSVPALAVSLLPPQALLVSRGQLHKIWLPDLSHVPSLAWRRLDWAKLGTRAVDVPTLPAYCEDVRDGADGNDEEATCSIPTSPQPSQMTWELAALTSAAMPVDRDQACSASTSM